MDLGLMEYHNPRMYGEQLSTQNQEMLTLVLARVELYLIEHLHREN